MDFGEDSSGSKRKRSPSGSNEKRIESSAQNDLSEAEELAKLNESPSGSNEKRIESSAQNDIMSEAEELALLYEYLSGTDESELKFSNENDDKIEPGLFKYPSGIDESELKFNDEKDDKIEPGLFKYPSGIDESELKFNDEKDDKIEPELFIYPFGMDESELRFSDEKDDKIESGLFTSINPPCVDISEDEDDNHEPQDTSMDNNQSINPPCVDISEDEEDDNHEPQDTSMDNNQYLCGSNKKRFQFSDPNYDRFDAEDITMLNTFRYLSSSFERRFKCSDKSYYRLKPEDLTELYTYSSHSNKKRFTIKVENYTHLKYAELKFVIVQSPTDSVEITTVTDDSHELYDSLHNELLKHGTDIPCMVITIDKYHDPDDTSMENNDIHIPSVDTSEDEDNCEPDNLSMDNVFLSNISENQPIFSEGGHYTEDLTNILRSIHIPCIDISEDKDDNYEPDDTSMDYNQFASNSNENALVLSDENYGILQPEDATKISTSIHIPCIDISEDKDDNYEPDDTSMDYNHNKDTFLCYDGNYYKFLLEDLKYITRHMNDKNKYSRFSDQSDGSLEPECEPNTFVTFEVSDIHEPDDISMNNNCFITLEQVNKILQNLDCQHQTDVANKELILKYRLYGDLYEQILTVLKEESGMIPDGSIIPEGANQERICATYLDLDLFDDWSESFVQEMVKDDQTRTENLRRKRFERRQVKREVEEEIQVNVQTCTENLRRKRFKRRQVKRKVKRKVKEIQENNAEQANAEIAGKQSKEENMAVGPHPRFGRKYSRKEPHTQSSRRYSRKGPHPQSSRRYSRKRPHPQSSRRYSRKALKSVIPDDNDTSITCEVHKTLERIFHMKFDHQYCPVKHISEKPDTSSQPQGKPIYQIIAGKLQPPIYPDLNDESKNDVYNKLLRQSSTSKETDIAEELQPPVYPDLNDESKNDIFAAFQLPILDPMNENSNSIDTAYYKRSKQRKIHKSNRKRCKTKDEIPIESDDITLPDTCTDNFNADMFPEEKDQSLSPPRTEIASDSKTLSFNHPDIVYKFDVNSKKKEIILYNRDESSCINVCLPSEEQITKISLLELRADDTSIDADMEMLIHLYDGMVQDSEQKKTFQYVPAQQIEFYNVLISPENNLPLTKSETEIIIKDLESSFATVGKYTLLPLNLKLNAYMHLKEFIQTVVDLSYEEAERKIVNSYFYGYLYSKLQNYLIATRNFSFVCSDV